MDQTDWVVVVSCDNEAKPASLEKHMLKVNVYAFWSIDQFPFYDGGEVCELLDGGQRCVIVNTHAKIVPAFIALEDHGRRIIKALKDLRKAGNIDSDFRKNARNNVANNVFREVGFPKQLETYGMSSCEANSQFLDQLERCAKNV
jgi:hypothetical protein